MKKEKAPHPVDHPKGVVLVRMTRDAAPGEPTTADVHPDEVENYRAGGWREDDAF